LTDPEQPEAVARALLGWLSDRLGRVDLDYAAVPERLFGGNQAFVYGFRLADAPPEYSGRLVVRILREGAGDAKLEAELQNAVAALGYPAPRVWFASSNPETLGGAFQVMERLAGRPLLLAGVDGGGVGEALAGGILRQVGGALFGAWPGELAKLQAQLHALDAERLLAAFESPADARERLVLASVIARLEGRVDADGLDGLRAGVAWLRDARPADRPVSLCHGDFFPNQVLAESDAVTGVIDWSMACLAPSEIDVGVVKAGIETLHLPVPGALAGLARGVAHRGVSRFVAAYRARRSLDEAAVRYGEVLRCLQVLAHTARGRRARAEGGSEVPGNYDHPRSVDAMVGRVRAIAGVEVRIEAPEVGERGLAG